MKKGRLGVDEKQFMLENAATMAPEEIARKLNRNVSTVQHFINRNYTPPSKEEQKKKAAKQGTHRAEIRRGLRETEWWRRIKQEFTADELKLFEERYVELLGQFVGTGGILPTEEVQISQSIKFELLMSRNLVARQQAIQDINRMTTQMTQFLQQFGGDTTAMSADDRSWVISKEGQIQSARAAEAAKSSEYVRLQEQHASLTKALKGTRDQRIKDAQEGTETILGLLKKLQDRAVQEDEGRRMELTKLAGKAAYNRLGQLHKYEDGNVDRPILSPETLHLGEKS